MSKHKRKKQKKNVPGTIPLADLLQLQEDMFRLAAPMPDSIRIFEYDDKRYVSLGYSPRCYPLSWSVE